MSRHITGDQPLDEEIKALAALFDAVGRSPEQMARLDAFLDSRDGPSTQLA